MEPDEILTISGDQIGSYSSLFASGNNEDRVVELSDVTALGSSSDVYTIEVFQTNGADQFQNGQRVTITDQDGNVIVDNRTIQPDLEQGMASGDEHLIIPGQNGEQNIVIDVGGVPEGPTTVDYGQVDQNAVEGVDDDDGNLDFDAVVANSSFPCLAAGTQVETPDGLITVEDLLPGMQVMTDGDVPRAVLWVGIRTLRFGDQQTDQRPVCFAKESLGPDLPRRDLVVSPGHRMYFSGPLSERLFGTPNVLPVARGMTPLPGVRIMEGKRQITYVSVLLDQHALMKAEGVLTESFYPGPYAMRIIGRGMRREVRNLIPGYDRLGPQAYGPPVARFLRLQEGRALARAHRKALQDHGHAAWDDLSPTMHMAVR
ncbi:Hint domain-containing protein [Yoonia maricola]|uniref:Hint domain-containing protein n=1 Tax=Yoonia maricola TaxID=420999 RepID=A0A2M8WMP9_9RHOB|nr:Hint domain-containing protein [Yoonia maricola]PJI92205.1 Hint domain-containing protein [Yoonia maricola]